MFPRKVETILASSDKLVNRAKMLWYNCYIMNAEQQPILTKPVPPDLVDYYFTKINHTQAYLLEEVVYDGQNKPVGSRHGKKIWFGPEARNFAQLCGGWILSAEDRVEEAKTVL